MSIVYTMTRTPDVLPGTLELLIARTLQMDVPHGWGMSERTASGRRQLAVEAREWERKANAIGRVMKFA